MMKLLFAAFLFSLLMIGCTPIYVPNNVNIPLYDEGGEIHIAAYTGSSGFDFQGGISLSDNIAVQVNTSIANRDSETSEDYHKHFLGELGISAFTHVEPNGYFTLGAGLGKGNVASNDNSFTFFQDPELLTAEGRFSRAYILGSAGIYSKSVRGGLALRISYVNFESMKFNKKDIYGLDWRKWEYFYEPVAYLEFGREHFCFLFQFGVSNSVHHDNSFDYEPVWVSIGAKIRIDAFK